MPYESAKAAVEDLLGDLVGESGTESKKWGEKQEACQGIIAKIDELGEDVAEHAEAIFWLLAHKPSFKEINAAALSAIFGVCGALAKHSTAISKPHIAYAIPFALNKFTDRKVLPVATEMLFLFAESAGKSLLCRLHPVRIQYLTHLWRCRP